jgi:hypothetical protein
VHIEYQVRYPTWFSLFLPGQRAGVRFSEFYTNKAVFFNIVTERIIALFRMAKHQGLALGFVATGVSGTVGTQPSAINSSHPPNFAYIWLIGSYKRLLLVPFGLVCFPLIE